MNSKYIFLLLICIGFFVESCHEDDIPRKREFQRIELPPKKYIAFSEPGCPFTFSIPEYAYVEPDTADKKAEPYWYNIRFPDFKATLHLSYKNLKSSTLQTAIEDSRTLVYKHTIKAEEIVEYPFMKDSITSGIRYVLEGNTATAYQFYLTDSKKHFLRAALYFNSRTNPDSVAPVYEFLKADAEHIIETLKWTHH